MGRRIGKQRPGRAKAAKSQIPAGADILQFIVHAMTWRLAKSAVRIEEAEAAIERGQRERAWNRFSKSSPCCLTRSAFSPRALFLRRRAARADLRLIEHHALMALALNP